MILQYIYTNNEMENTMSQPMIRTKNTKFNSNHGPFGRKRGTGGAGKGDIISGTFGDGWEKNAEDRLSKRRYQCSNKECGKLKPSGKCEYCNFEPTSPRGW